LGGGEEGKTPWRTPSPQNQLRGHQAPLKYGGGFFFFKKWIYFFPPDTPRGGELPAPAHRGPQGAPPPQFGGAGRCRVRSKVAFSQGTLIFPSRGTPEDRTGVGIGPLQHPKSGWGWELGPPSTQRGDGGGDWAPQLPPRCWGGGIGGTERGRWVP